MDTIFAILARPALPILCLWHGVGFLAVLAAGRRPVWPAIIYGPPVGLAATALTVADQAKTGWPLPILLSAVAAGCGIHLYGQLKRSLHRDHTGMLLLRSALACAFPLVGPIFALGTAAVVLWVRRRDHLDLLD